MRLRWIPALALLLVACDSAVDISAVPELPVVATADVAEILATTDTPIVLNVWASWCVPCRSEAPLLEQAATTTAGDVRFIGLNVRDSQSGAREFIAEFFPAAPIEHLADPSGSIPIDLGGTRGVPLTFFYDRTGALVELHSGVIDERTLALQIDEILRR